MRFLLVATLFAVAFAAPAKDDLSADAARLKQLANSEIQKLAAEGKTFLAKELQVLENEILAVEKKLESLNPTTELGRIGVSALKSVLKGLETKLENEVKKLSAGSFYASTKDALIADASKLKKLADAEIKKLESAGKTLLAKEIQVLEKEIVSVEKQLASVNPSNEAGKIAVSALSAVLKGIENKLEAEIKKLGGAFYEATKEALTGDVNRLKQLADSEIKKLASTGKSFLAKELQVLEDEIIAVEKKLESLNPTNELGRISVSALKSVLKGLETKLESEVKKLSAGTFYASTKDALIADASKLQKLAESEIKKLEASGKTLLAKEIQVLEKEIVSIEKQLASVNPSNEAGKIAVSALATVLKGVETKLEAEIKKLGGK